MNKIQLAIAPIGWSNDDMPEIGAHISFEQCIKEMAEAGFQGCEVGHKFPKHPETLHLALAPYQLKIASAWFSTFFTENRKQETIEKFIKHMEFLKAMHANVIVVCECGNSIQQKPLSIIDFKPVFTEQQWHDLIQGLHLLGNIAQNNNMHLVYHHHMGTGIQSGKDIDYLLNNTDADFVSLLLDTGHLHFADENPLHVLEKHIARIKHVHLKDIRQTTLEKVKLEKLSFLEAVKTGVFTVPGDGCIDFLPIAKLLMEKSYEGWWVVEAEQDPVIANPLQYAKMAREFIRKISNL